MVDNLQPDKEQLEELAEDTDSWEKPPEELMSELNDIYRLEQLSGCTDNLFKTIAV